MFPAASNSRGFSLRAIRSARGFIALAILGLHFGLSGMTFDRQPPVIPPCEVARPGTERPAVGSVPVRNGSDVARPDVQARTAVVIDGESGRVLFGKRAHARRAPASTTKIMTAILALEATRGDERIVSTVDARVMHGSSVMGLTPGVEVTVSDLLYGLMLPSGNDAALELARLVSGTEDAFVDRMNERVEELRLADTRFENPHGLDERGHYSSAYDLAIIARDAMRNEQFRAIVSTPQYAVSTAPEWTMGNGNSLLGIYPGADGVKIGWTDMAGWTFVGSVTRDGHRVIAAVLDTPDRDGDVAAMLDWVFATYNWRETSAPSLAEIGREANIGGSRLDALATACG